MIYKIENIPRLKNLQVEVEPKGTGLKTRVSGAGSPWLHLLIKRYFGSHNSLGLIGTKAGGNVYTLYFPPVPSKAHARLFESFISTRVFKKPRPMAATIGITDLCQYCCEHCSAAGRSTDQPVMTFQEIKRVVDQCIELGVSNITFTGGEPLLRDDLADLVAYVPQELCVTQVFTNAAELNSKKIDELKKAGLFGLQVSLDSPDPVEHDHLRGSTGAFTAVEQGVMEASRAGLFVGISTYATRDRMNDHFVPRMADLATEWGAHEITIFDAIETGNLKGKNYLCLDRTSRRRLISDMARINRQHNKAKVVTQSWTNSGRGFSRLIGCLAAGFQLHITARGEFTPCDFTPLSFGNIRESTVGELWQKLTSHPEYNKQKLRCRMQDKTFRQKYIDTIPEGAKLPYRISDDNEG